MEFTSDGLVQHSDAGAQYTSLAFTQTLTEAGIDGSIGTVGDALDNAMMESAIGLYKTELIDFNPDKNWQNATEVERETAPYVYWYNHQRLHSSIADVPPIEYEHALESQQKIRKSPVETLTPTLQKTQADSTLATTYRDLDKQGMQLEEHISMLVEMINPHVTSIFGCGAVVAADLIVSVGDNPGRIHSEAALAHLCGVAPIPASSGRTHRHRLNLGGDRRANSALHRIALVRMRHDQRTRDYVTKRTKEGLSKKEILRCLKRAIVREVYRILCLHHSSTPSGEIGVDELKARRIERQLSQAQVAEKLGCTSARISDTETGKRPLLELRSAYEELLKSA